LRRKLNGWIDYHIVARWITQINPGWKFHATIDAGLGSDTDFTSSLLTCALYQINDWSDLNLAYKST